MKRIAFLTLGIFFALLGVAGVLLPVLPGILFFVIAAYFFSLSSETMHKALYKIPYIGKAILDWDTSKRIGPQARATILFLLFWMTAYPYFILDNKAYAIIMTNFFFVSLFTLFAIEDKQLDPRD